MSAAYNTRRHVPFTEMISGAIPSNPKLNHGALSHNENRGDLGATPAEFGVFDTEKNRHHVRNISVCLVW
jgi:hypothetical protein